MTRRDRLLTVITSELSPSDSELAIISPIRSLGSTMSLSSEDASSVEVSILQDPLLLDARRFVAKLSVSESELGKIRLYFSFGITGSLSLEEVAAASPGGFISSNVAFTSLHTSLLSVFPLLLISVAGAVATRFGELIVESREGFGELIVATVEGPGELIVVAVKGSGELIVVTVEGPGGLIVVSVEGLELIAVTVDGLGELIVVPFLEVTGTDVLVELLAASSLVNESDLPRKS